MKEIHYFFAPDAEITEELPDEEARHAAKVLRLNRGDEIVLIDGKGLFHKAKVVEISRVPADIVFMNRNVACLLGADEYIWLLPLRKTWSAWSGW